MSQRSAGLCTHCTRANAFPAYNFHGFLINDISINMPFKLGYSLVLLFKKKAFRSHSKKLKTTKIWLLKLVLLYYSFKCMCLEVIVGKSLKYWEKNHNAQINCSKNCIYILLVLLFSFFNSMFQIWIWIWCSVFFNVSHSFCLLMFSMDYFCLAWPQW